MHACTCSNVDICYLVAEENIPAVKYPALLELETQHGITLGLTYSNARSQATTILLGRKRDIMPVQTPLSNARLISSMV